MRLLLVALILILLTPTAAQAGDGEAFGAFLEACIEGGIETAEETRDSTERDVALGITTFVCVTPLISTTVGLAVAATSKKSGGGAPNQRPAHVQRQEAFAQANFAALRRDTAAGGGEHLSAFARLFDCDPEADPLFTERSRDQYQRIYGPRVDIEYIAESTRQVMREDPALLRACARL